MYRFSLNQGALLARHERCYEHEQDVFDPLHYLGCLNSAREPLSMLKSIATMAEDLASLLPSTVAWLREQWPEGRGVKEFVQVLRLARGYPAPSLVEQAVEQALTYGSTHLDGVKLCLEHLQAADAHTTA